MVPSRRRFVIGCGAVAANAVFGGQLGRGEAAPFTTPLPLPRLIDAAASRHAVNLIAMPGRHAFVEGKLARTYGYSAPVLGPLIRVRRGDEVQMVVENRLNTATTVHWPRGRERVRREGFMNYASKLNHADSLGVDSAVPRLVGRDANAIVAAMQAFRSGQIPSTVMDRIAKGFTDDEIRAIAAWYAVQKE